MSHWIAAVPLQVTSVTSDRGWQHCVFLILTLCITVRYVRWTSSITTNLCHATVIDGCMIMSDIHGHLMPEIITPTYSAIQYVQHQVTYNLGVNCLSTFYSWCTHLTTPPTHAGNYWCHVASRSRFNNIELVCRARWQSSVHSLHHCDHWAQLQHLRHCCAPQFLILMQRLSREPERSVQHPASTGVRCLILRTVWVMLRVIQVTSELRRASNTLSL